jgi:hypothetical protein
MQKTAIFIIALIALQVSATKIDFTSFSELATTEFSRSVVQMMQMNMNMNTDGSLSQITSLMNKIKSQLENAQRADDSQNAKDTKQCS